MTRRQLLTLIATVLGSGVVILDGTVVNLALPSLAEELGASFSDLQWIIDGYLLSLSSLILLGGSLGDIFGRKKVFLVGLIGFGAASVLCGLAPSSSTLIAARVVQGVFGALLVPGALAIINTNFSSDQRGQAIGRWAAWSGITTAIGPPLGGYLVDTASWRWIFFINVPLILTCLYLALPNIEESKSEESRSVDYVGAFLAMVALTGIIFGLIEGPGRDWNLATSLPLVFGAGLFAFFLIFEWRKSDPMLNLRLFSSANFTSANISTFAMYGALSGFFFALVIYLQAELGYSGTAAGVSLLPVTFLLLALSGKVGQLAGKYGPRLFMTAGPIIAGIGMLYLLNLDTESSYVSGLLPGVALFGLGLALTVAPLTITVMASVNKADSGIASGINNAIARVAGLVVIALLGIFGAGQSYRFAVILSSSMAFAAGAVSYLLVRTPKSPDNEPRGSDESG